MAPEFGGYATARLNGDAVAGIGPAQGEDAPPSAWTTYLAADDAEATAGKITAAGGQVLMPAMTIGSFGTMAVVTDPTGGVFGLWQSGDHKGVDLYNEPGSSDLERGDGRRLSGRAWTSTRRCSASPTPTSGRAWTIPPSSSTARRWRESARVPGR